MKKDDTIYLHHILECIRRIEEDVAEGRECFMASHTLQDAVLRNLQVMAESTQRLSETAKATQPDIEWREIAAFRNILVHDYLGTDLDTVWDITQRDIPKLKHAAEEMERASQEKDSEQETPPGQPDLEERSSALRFRGNVSVLITYTLMGTGPMEFVTPSFTGDHKVNEQMAKSTSDCCA